ncbi:MAG: hypothetical protein EOO02_11760 [Chitinophagaceae bacterium]|nr:MAG: hypothetical protein EOO02_11760 [Chitinophagaceae bacterium]
MVKRLLLILSIVMAILIIICLFFRFEPDHNTKIPTGITIDKIIVFKSERKLVAYSEGKAITAYKVALGRNPVGPKEYEGDQKTPEGTYRINGKNPNSSFHKNLGISYPNRQDVEKAKKLGKPPGGEIKIHGIKNGHGSIGELHRMTDWTNGCIALTDQEIDELYKHTPIGTSIEIRK